MNKKYCIILVILTLPCLILAAYYYPHYQKYFPTSSDEVIFPLPLSEQKIKQIRSYQPITKIKVFKSQRQVHLLHNQEKIRSYPMRLGFSPVGHKQQEGDGKTPEGQYVIDWRNPNSAFYKSLHISYPNAQDKTKAHNLGVSPGGDVMIHGSNYKLLSDLPKMMEYFPRQDWTLGCIAVRNIDMDEIWKLVDNGTMIEIYP